MNFIQSMWDLIILEKNWSWAVIGLFYLIVTFVIRGFFFHPVLQYAKTLDRKRYQEIKKNYLKRSLGGWILYLASFLLVVLPWLMGDLVNPSIYETLVLTIAVVSFALSLVFHLSAFNIASLDALKYLEDSQISL